MKPSTMTTSMIALATALGAWLIPACDGEEADVQSPPAQADAGAADGGAASGPRKWHEFGFEDSVLDELVLFYLGHAWDQSADVGEVLETASRVDETDPTSWLREWKKTAERLDALGATSERGGHPLTASHAYLRAATYYRAALHRTSEPFAPEVRELAQKEVDAFGKHLTLSKSPCVAVQIPYESTTLPGYFCKSPVANGRAPTILYHQGRDAWAEDGRAIAEEAMKHGYHVLMFDGPGAGKVIRLQGLAFRHDWEKVVTPVVDYALARSEVDPARLGLMAFSMGGFLAPRAATAEHRLKVLVANPGVVDWSAVFEAHIQGLDPELLPLLESDEAAFNARIEGYMKASPFLHWGVVDTMWHHGVDTPAKLIKELRKYKLTPEDVAQITAHSLVVDAEAEERGQAKQLFDLLKAPKEYLLFTARETAQFHDQPGASAILVHRLMEWLDKAL